MSVTRRTATNVLLDTALKNFYGAAEEMGLDDKLISILSAVGVEGDDPLVGEAARAVDEHAAGWLEL